MRADWQQRAFAATCSLSLFGACAASANGDTSPAQERTGTQLAAQAGAAGHAAPSEATVVLPSPTPEETSPTRTKGRASIGHTPLPCAVERVLATSCQGCHAADPGTLAPMALVTHEDLIAPAVGDPSVKVYEMMSRRVHATTQSMPPATSRPLTDDEVAVLDRFIAERVPAGSDGDCDSGALDANSKPTTAASAAPAAPDDTGTCYRFQAHDREAAGDSTPFQAPSGEYYSCFYFDVPWPEGTQAVSARALDVEHAHHFALYDANDPYVPGQITRQASDCGFQPRPVLAIYGRSEPTEQDMPDDVGLQLPAPGSGHSLLLEVHYFNPDATVTDSVGVELCSAKAPRPHVAGISLLNVDQFELPQRQATDIESTCSPQVDGDIHVFRALPHMHARGIGMTSTIERGGGGVDELLDVSFDFNNQRLYQPSAVIHPGDRVRTTCHFRNDTDFTIFAGVTSADEMCVDFVYAWPAGALAHPTDGVAEVCED